MTHLKLGWFIDLLIQFQYPNEVHLKNLGTNEKDFEDDFPHPTQAEANDSPSNNRDSVDYVKVSSSNSLTENYDKDTKIYKRSQSVMSWDTVWEEDLGQAGFQGFWGELFIFVQQSVHSYQSYQSFWVLHFSTFSTLIFIYLKVYEPWFFYCSNCCYTTLSPNSSFCNCY